MNKPPLNPNPKNVGIIIGKYPVDIPIDENIMYIGTMIVCVGTIIESKSKRKKNPFPLNLNRAKPY